MANEWLRLWHDMPNDPKWRTIARNAGQPIALVQATYLHLLVDASRNVTRGHATVTTEDIASALDVTDEHIDTILTAMQGRVLDGMHLLGWEKRQPKREDSGDTGNSVKSATERKRAQRAREQAERGGVTRGVTDGHDMSRDVTTDKDTDTDKESSSLRSEDAASAAAPAPAPPHLEPKPSKTRSLTADDLQGLGVTAQVAVEFLAMRKRKRAALTELALAGIEREADKAGISLDAALRKCLERGWQGFEAAWVSRDSAQLGSETPWQRAARERMQAAVPNIAARAPEARQASDFFIDVEAKRVAAPALD